MSENTTRTSLDLLYKVSRELTSDLDLHTVLARALSLSSKSIGAERASIIVVDEHQQPVEAAIIVQDRLMPHTVELLRGTLEHGLAGWVFRNRQPALISDSSQDERWQQRPDDAVERSGAKSALCVPVITRDQVVGIITIVHPLVDFFTQEHLTLLSAIADQAGIAIFNARLHGDLQAAHRRYQELFEDSIDPICITGWNGVILEANRQAEKLSGYIQQPLRGRHMNELLGLSIDWLLEKENELHRNHMVQAETTLKSHSGDPIPVEAYLRRVNISGEDALQWILRDISERKALDTLRETLTESIVHDLRAPLSNIISSLEFLNMFLPVEDSQSLHEVLSIASRSASRMFRLITSLLDLNRLENGQAVTERTWVDPAVLIRDATDAVQPNADGKRQQLNTHPEAKLPKLWVDQDMIARVIINLLDNAVKYSPNEGRISIGSHLRSGMVEFYVQDSGPGIPPEERDTVFNRFYRLHTEHKKTGFGLGLAFCKLAVEAHNGRIWVESQPGEGCTFFFALPVTAAPPPAE
jgi:two-component system, NtrC family, sensor histidine kinase KinB